MKMKTKVNAFTLQELIITMIISTIVIGLAFSVLSMVQRHMWAIQHNFNLNTEYNRLEQALWIDSVNYNVMRYNREDSQLSFKTTIDSVVYKFEGDYVLRDQDTFQISIPKRTLYFNGEEVIKGKIDAIKLELKEEFKDQHVFVFKINDAFQFIE